MTTRKPRDHQMVVFFTAGQDKKKKKTNKKNMVILPLSNICIFVQYSDTGLHIGPRFLLPIFA